MSRLNRWKATGCQLSTRNKDCRYYRRTSPRGDVIEGTCELIWYPIWKHFTTTTLTLLPYWRRMIEKRCVWVWKNPPLLQKCSDRNHLTESSRLSRYIIKVIDYNWILCELSISFLNVSAHIWKDVILLITCLHQMCSFECVHAQLEPSFGRGLTTNFSSLLSFFTFSLCFGYMLRT